MPIFENAAKLTDLDVFAFRLCPAIPGSQSGAAAQAQLTPYDVLEVSQSLKDVSNGVAPVSIPDRARTILLQNPGLFGGFFESLPTGGDARHKRLARLAL